MNESNMQRSKVALKKGVVERSQGSSVGLKFDVVEFKDLLGGVSPSQWVWLTPPEASGSASSSSAAAPTAAASTAAAPTAVQATTPKFKLAPSPSPRGVPGQERELLQVRFFTFGLQRLAQVYKKNANAKQFRQAVIADPRARVSQEAVSGP